MFEHRRPKLLLSMFVSLMVIGTLPYVYIGRLADLQLFPEDSDSNQLLNVTASKWIVVASSSGPSDRIRELSQIHGWKLLLVTETGNQLTWGLSGTNSVVLNAFTQARLPYRLLDYLPRNIKKRKVIGYLFAIEHGAEFIFDLDADSIPDDPTGVLSALELNRTTRGLLVQPPSGNIPALINPYTHFGLPSVWPRGFPLKYVEQVQSNLYTACTHHSPLIQQGLVDGEPDLDHMFQREAPLNFQFDRHAPRLICPANALAPLSSRNTLFHYDAFWALLLPVSVEDRVADIWRGYWAQPLLWKLGGRVSFSPPRGRPVSKTSAYMQPFREEDKLTEALVDFLSTWTCKKKRLYACLSRLTAAMADENMWSVEEMNVLEAWIEDLDAMGYVQPKFRERSSCLEGESQSEVIFNAINPQARLIKKHRAELRGFCNFTIASPAPSEHKTVPGLEYPDTLLIVIFNNPFFGNIWLLDLIYRPHYPNILYCGNIGNITSQIYRDLLKRPSFIQTGLTEFSLLNAPDIGLGSFTYDCAVRAIDINYGVNGYLVIQDDSLMNFWNYRTFNHDEVWIEELKARHLVRTDLPVNSTGWKWWGSKWGLSATRRALEIIYGVNQTNLVKEFVARRENWGYNSTTAVLCQADAFYFPASSQDMVYEVGSVLRESQVYLEVSIPTLFSGLSAPWNTVDMKGHNLYGEARDRPFEYFDATLSILHPLKLSHVIRNDSLRQQYCSKYVSLILDNP